MTKSDVTREAHAASSQGSSRLLRRYLLLALFPVLLTAFHFATWHRPQCTRVAFSPDGKLLASVYLVSSTKRNHDATIDVRSVTSGRVVFRCREPSWVTALAYSVDSSKLVTGHVDGLVKIWDLTTGNLDRSFRETTHAIRGLSFSMDGESVLAVSDSLLVMLDRNSGAVLASLIDPDSSWGDAAVHGDRLAAAEFGNRGDVRIYRVKANTFEQESVLNLNVRGRVTWFPDGETLAVSNGQRVQLWNVDEQRMIRELGYPPNIGVGAEAVSPDGLSIASATPFPGSVVLRNAATGAQTATVDTGKIWQVTFSPDGSGLAGAGRDGTTTIWDAKSLRHLRAFSSHGRVVLLLWCLLAAFLIWCVVWVWCGRAEVKAMRPLFDACFINGLILAAVLVRMWSVFSDDLAAFADARAVFFALVGSILGLPVAWLALRGIRLSLLISMSLVTLAVLWFVALLPTFITVLPLLRNWPQLHIAAGATIGGVFYFVAMLAVARLGIRIVHPCDPKWRATGNRQVHLQDLLIGMTVIGVLLSIARFFPTEPIAVNTLLSIALVSVLLMLTLVCGVFAGLGKRPLRSLLVSVGVAFGSGWLGAIVFPDSGHWFFVLEFWLIPLVVGTLLIFRLHGYKLERKERPEDIPTLSAEPYHAG